MGFRPDWEGFFRGGLEGIEAMLLEDVKHKKKMKEMEDEYRLRGEEEEKKRQASMQEGAMQSIFTLFGDPDVEAITKRALYGKYIIPFLSSIGQAPPTQAGAVMPGGVAGMEGMEPMPREEVAGYGALFEAPVEEPEERKYPYTKAEVREHEEFKAERKPKPIGKTAEERQIDRDLATIQKYAGYKEKQIKKMGVWSIIEAARNRLRKRNALQRYANDADTYYDRMLGLYKGNTAKAREETIKFIRMMGIEPSVLAPHLRER